MTDLDQLMQEDAQQRPATVTDLGVFMALAEEQLAAEQLVVRREEALAAAKKALELIQNFRLPDLMQQVGLTEFKLRDGRKVSIKPEYAVNISEARRERAMQWLRERGEGGVIKNVVSVPFGKDQDAFAQRLLQQLEAHGYAAEQKESVHTGTLRALIKRRIEAGHEVDMELFQVYPVNKAVISASK
jgi:hypothetical protein